MFRWLVNGIFLALPVGTTIGVLMGIQAINRANGKPPPLSGGDNGWLPGVGPVFGKDQIVMSCDTADGIYSKAQDGLDFSLSANPWGWKKDSEGNICMMVNLNGNQTYETQWTAPPFNVTWQYPRALGAKNVHAFANAKVMSPSLPTKLSSIEKLDFGVKWFMSLNNKTDAKISDHEFSVNQINANVAIDMFMDKDSTKAGEPEKASHEIMVWFARFGTDTFPIGKKSLEDKGLKTKTLDGTDFNLFYGTNSITNQKVLSWVASEPANHFNGSLQPLLDEIFAFNNDDYPQKSDYIGYFAFGQEAYSSLKNVTFSVPHLSVDFETTS
ncbi:hypothetical protein E4U42_007456 [Claviceps africana]|uniref:Uncharacterized protein n=1 Tax=Claviceps africana TaxID=83212 RepID=A0A8K0NEK4_9HYPO|nr:hypothetical protein E4U42_007456 [Claviceps africana]